METIILKSLDGLEKIISNSGLDNLYIMPIVKPITFNPNDIVSINQYSMTQRKYRYNGNYRIVGAQRIRIFDEVFEEVNTTTNKVCTHNWTVYHGLTTVETICTLCNEKK